MQRREFAMPLPDRMKALPIDKRGFPVPSFVQWIDGAPDFRCMDPDHLVKCIRHKACWICGEKMGQFMCFVIGPMCCINRISSEPPSHYECGLFAAMACPFLTKPLAKRPGVEDLVERFGDVKVAGVMVERNPGIACLWVTKSYKTVNHGGILFQIGPPDRLEFYREARAATREEIDTSVNGGLPFLLKAATDHRQPVEHIYEAKAEFEKLLPDYWKQKTAA